MLFDLDTFYNTLVKFGNVKTCVDYVFSRAWSLTAYFPALDTGYIT